MPSSTGVSTWRSWTRCRLRRRSTSTMRVISPPSGTSSDTICHRSLSLMQPEQKLLQGPALVAVLKLLERRPHSSHELASQLRVACPEALAQGDASLLALLYYLEAHQLAASS